MFVNMLGNMLIVIDFVFYVEEFVVKYDFECEILEKLEMEEFGMGGIFVVN